MALLIAHFSRLQIRGELSFDQMSILVLIPRLISALVDVCSTLGFVKPLLCAMELSQMVVQGQWSTDSPLIQMPNIDREKAKKYKKNIEIDSIYDVLYLNSEQRRKLFSHLPGIQMAKLIKFCNKYPDIQANIITLNKPAPREQVYLEFQFHHEFNQEFSLSSKDTYTNESDSTTSIIHDFYLNDSFFSVESSRYPGIKQEGWWILGVDATETVLFIKKVVLYPNRFHKYNLRTQFIAPDKSGKYKITIHLMSDSYCGCDQEFILEYEVN
jgi:pre-mRNA-splicing helicase BRR2